MKSQCTLKSAFWAVLLGSIAAGEDLRIGTSADWQEWQRPGNAIEISRGKAGPRFVRRNIDAVANAGDFGGGIRAAGSNSGEVDRVRILGDLAGIAPSSVDWRWTRRNAIHFPWYIIWATSSKQPGR